MTTIYIIPIILVLYLIMTKTVAIIILKLGDKKQVPKYRTRYVIRTLKISIAFTLIMFLMLGYGMKYEQFTVFLSSVFAVIGIAFFAQWSILSNITASIIIFFVFPYRIGDTVEILDSDINVRGDIEDITLFHMLVRTEDEKLVTYPNTLVLQKVVIKVDTLK